MMQVPTIDTFQKQANVVQGRVSAPEVQDFASRQALETGRALQGAGSTMAAIANDEQQRANQVFVDGALNSAKQAALDLTYGKDTGYTNIKGLDALKRQSGKPLADEYSEQLQKRIADLSNGLGNPQQRQAFEQHAAGILQSFRTGAMRHESQEFQTHELSVAEGIQATALDEIGKRWNEPAAIDAAVERIRAQTYRQGQLLGKSAEWNEAQARKMMSHGHKTAILTALEQKNPAYAAEYLARITKSEQLSADDAFEVRGKITGEANHQLGVERGNQAISKVAPAIEGSPMEILNAITLQAESGGRRYGSDGKLLESPKGAKGEMQVLDGTNKDPGFGVTPARDDSPEERARVGRDYLQAMLRRYSGDAEKMWAAYNAGPGAVDKALAAAEKNANLGKLGTLSKNDPSIRRDWIDFLPEETRQYVAKNKELLEKAQKGGSVIARPSLNDVQQSLMNDPLLANNPDALKVAMAQAKSRYELLDNSIKQRGDEVKTAAFQALLANGGDYNALSPGLRGQIAQYIPGEADNLKQFGAKIAKGEDTTSEWLYSKLAGHPEALGRMSDNEFFALRKELSESDFKHFANERAKLTGAASGSNGPGDLNSQAIKQTLDERLRMLKIDPTPKDSDKVEMSRVGAVRKFVNDYFIAAQREAGKKFTDAEVAQHVDALFARNATFRGFLSNSTGTMLSMKADDIPPVDKDGLKAAFKRLGNDSPSEAELLNAYWTMKVARK